MSETKFNAEIASKIVEIYASGKLISEICEELGIGMTTLHSWRLKYPEFNEECLRAQDIGYEVQVDKLLNIFKYYKDVNQARVISENTRWAISKRSPQKYGDKLTLDINQTIDIKSALLEAKQRIGIQAPSQIEQAIDVTPENLIIETDNKSVDAKIKDTDLNELDDLLK